MHPKPCSSLACSFLVALLAACQPSKPSPDTGPVDADLDGTPAALDCDDTDANVHPGAVEICDGKDDDCNDLVDDDPADGNTFYADADADGYGDPAETVLACEAPAGYVADGNDCDDTDAQVYPGSHATEVPGDGVDQDCDGLDACVDLDCDGWSDLVVLEYSGAGVDRYHFDGAGWTSRGDPALEAVSRPVSGVVADLDGDGWPDLAAGGYDARSGAVWPGGGTGFSDDDAVEMEVSYAVDLVARDLDGDGHPDLLFVEYGDTSHVFWGPDFDSSTELAITRPWAATVADLDGDGLPEIVLGSRAGDVVGIFTGESRYQDEVELDAPSSYHPLAADLDGDGWPELVVPAWNDDDCRIFWGSEDDYDPTATTTLDPSHATWAAAEDLDLDGYTDLVFASYTGGDGVNTVWIYWGGPGGYDPEDRTALGQATAWSLAISDLDGDGYPELVLPAYRDLYGDIATTAQVYWGSAGGYADADRTDLEVVGATRVTVADLDDDGLPDLVFNSYQAGEEGSLRIYYYTGSGYDEADAEQIATGSVWAGVIVVGRGAGGW